MGKVRGDTRKEIIVKKEDSALSVGVGCFMLIFALPISYIVYGLVLVQLWQWFIVRWFDIKPITIPIGIGISLIVGLLTTHLQSKEADKVNADRAVLAIAVIALGKSVLSPLIVLFIGWIFQMFIQ